MPQREERKIEKGKRKCVKVDGGKEGREREKELGDLMLEERMV